MTQSRSDAVAAYIDATTARPSNMSVDVWERLLEGCTPDQAAEKILIRSRGLISDDAAHAAHCRSTANALLAFSNLTEQGGIRVAREVGPDGSVIDSAVARRRAVKPRPFERISLVIVLFGGSFEIGSAVARHVLGLTSPSLPFMATTFVIGFTLFEWVLSIRRRL